MPIVWRYLLSNYFKVLILCVVAFIAVLLTTRLDEIAHFASLGPEGWYIVLFTLYQIPYILPIAIPISCLISAILLIQRLSRSHELTALRASGMGLKTILGPILIAAAFVGALNFYIVSELATHSHLTTGLLKNELRSLNPLLLLHHKQLIKVHGIFFNTLGGSKLGEMDENVVLALPPKHGGGIHVIIADRLSASDENFEGEGVALIGTLKLNENEEPDQVFVENIGESSTANGDFSMLTRKKVIRLNADHLQLPLLLAHLQEQKAELQVAQTENKPVQVQKQLQREVNRSYSDIMRRFSLALAAFTFTLMGAAFGVTISRSHSNRGIAVVIGLAAFFMVSFFVAKSVDHSVWIMTTLYLGPHILIVAASLFTLSRAARGIE